ncbi:hemerythrin domain-containing protein [Peptoniphilus sp. KCTC 25270]|uniref:hemerythrin domain-containing protein n=1 Tax=Peptoniphilus sp. KCTC 25270 TaxID=2897414 RepID=UPI001E6518B5|nr:hemerythrin domain-containing protein [Peptoniphilus sp. KCTC 25270]MCD1146658.1 hemerythrin domain-containing protein [Peptoniphilus sp. KCTC 25270]
MYGIEILVYEHDQILVLTKTIRKWMESILHGEEILAEEVRDFIDIIRNYTDAHHHGKEEEILFSYMLKELGPVAEKVVRQGMLVEHDQARGIVRDWEEALNRWEENPTEEGKVDLIGLGYSYARLLEAHATRENDVVYPFAERNLSEESKEKVDELSRSYEEEKEKFGVQKKYLQKLKVLSDKYL